MSRSMFCPESESVGIELEVGIGHGAAWQFHLVLIVLIPVI